MVMVWKKDISEVVSTVVIWWIVWGEGGVGGGGGVQCNLLCMSLIRINVKV